MDALPRNIDEHSAADEVAGAGNARRRDYRALAEQAFMRR
jgi:hypothetical protein